MLAQHAKDADSQTFEAARLSSQVKILSEKLRNSIKVIDLSNGHIKPSLSYLLEALLCSLLLCLFDMFCAAAFTHRIPGQAAAAG